MPPPRITFDLSAPGRDPERYAISIDLLARGLYSEPAGEGELPYQAGFAVSAPLRDRVFALAQQLDYFSGDYDFRKHKIADTGRKTLAYSDALRQTRTTYNWSQNKGIQELTRIFHAIANTQQFARKIEHARRYDRLGLDALLKRMEEMARQGDLAELSAIAPLLEQVASDRTAMQLTRQRAQRLLDIAAALNPPSAPR